jgi:hypothetical protein
MGEWRENGAEAIFGDKQTKNFPTLKGQVPEALKS